MQNLFYKVPSTQIGPLKVFHWAKTFLFSSLIVLLVACTPQVIAPITTDTPTLTPTSTKPIFPTITETPSPTTKPPDLTLDSPNGEFIAELDNAFSHPAYEPQVIQILDKNGSLLWEIPYQHETAMVDPHPSLNIYGWSKDSTYLYFHYDSSPDGGDYAFWWDGFDLQRINVQTGNIERVVSSHSNGYVAFAFSADETQIAYTRAQDNPSIIFIRNLSTGAEKTANVIFPSKNYIRVGNIHWSPSGKEIALQTETSDYMVQTIYLDLSTMKQKVIREYELFIIDFQGWTSDGKLEFREFKSYWDTSSQIVHVDPRNNMSVVIGTPTPRP